MNGKILLLFVCIAALLGIIQAQYGRDCPQSNTISNCKPKCIGDHDCSGNKKCCPNLCGSSSCIEPSSIKTGTAYKSTNQGTGGYCGRTKCNSYEKCIHEKCVRS